MTRRFQLEVHPILLAAVMLALSFCIGLVFTQTAHAYPKYGDNGIYEYEYENGEATITRIAEKKAIGSIKIPSKINGNIVTEIGSYAFSSQKRMTDVTIPSTVKIIGDSAFSQCAKLKSIKIPSTVTDIDEFAFFNCRALAAVYLPKSLTYVGDDAFGLDKLKHVYYSGSKSQWKKISFGDMNTELTKATIHYNYSYSTTGSSSSSAKLKAGTISSLKALSNGFTVKWKTQKVATGYQVRLSLGTKMTAPMVMTVKGQAKSSLKIRGLQAKEKFCVQVRAYKTSSGKTTYSAWSTKKTVKTK